MSEIRVRAAVPPDSEPLARLREGLWPESSAAEHARELRSLLAEQRHGTMPMTIFVAEAESGELAGFLEAGLRSHADGCDPQHAVGFIEGWFVSENYRRRGIGRSLLAAAEAWARSHGCIEMASDTWIDQDLSQRVHEALKFEIVDRCVHYRKRL